MPKVYIRRVVKFNAAHRLHNPEMSDAWNLATFGKCNNPNWHGHNYILEVVVAGEPDALTGFVVDLSDLKKIIEDRIVARCDHKNLNVDVEFLKGQMTSTENFAVEIWKELEPLIPTGELHCVRLHETDNNSVEYYGE